MPPVEFERFVRIALGLAFCLWGAMRWYYSRLAQRTGGARLALREPSVWLLRGLIVWELATLAGWMFLPQWPSIFFLGLAQPVRIAGCLALAPALLLFGAVHRAMRANFSSILSLRENHVLVTSGPYRHVRHPMYLAFLLWNAAVALAAGDLLIAVSWPAGLLLVITVRLRREEAMMAERFGSAWAAYAERTRRFIPGLF